MKSLAKAAFDLVYDTIPVYRALVEAVSRPGTIADIGEQAAKLNLPKDEDNAALALALTLLDDDVTCFISLRDDNDLAQEIEYRTFCGRAEPSKADYLFVQGNMENGDVVSLLHQVKKGTWLYPEESATLLVRAEDIRETGLADRGWILSGPGIRDVARCELEGVSAAMLEERNRLNAEYPLGIDMMFYTAQGKLLAIPRTTAIRGGIER